MIGEITRVSKDHAAANRRVRDSLRALTSQAGEHEGAVAGLFAVAEQLGREARGLQEKVGRFKRSEGAPPRPSLLLRRLLPVQRPPAGGPGGCTTARRRARACAPWLPFDCASAAVARSASSRAPERALPGRGRRPDLTRAFP